MPKKMVPIAIDYGCEKLSCSKTYKSLNSNDSEEGGYFVKMIDFDARQ